MQRFGFALCAVALNAGLAACDSQPGPFQQAARNPEKPAVRSDATQAPKASAQRQLSEDMALSDKVKELLQEPARSHVEVAAADGVVTLYGTVEAPNDKERIALLAMGVDGVRSVVNNLIVLRGS